MASKYVNIKYYHRDTGGDLSGNPVRAFSRRIEKAVERSAEDLEEIVFEAARQMEQAVATRATAWGKSQGKQGRIETGKMVEAIDWKVGKVSEKGNITGRFGWINGVEDYFKFQEGGFTHNWDGHHVEGMYALSDALAWAKGELESRISTNVRP